MGSTDPAQKGIATYHCKKLAATGGRNSSLLFKKGALTDKSLEGLPKQAERHEQSSTVEAKAVI